MSACLPDYFVRYGGWLGLAVLPLPLLLLALYALRRGLRHEGRAPVRLGVVTLAVGWLVLATLLTGARFARQVEAERRVGERTGMNLVDPSPIGEVGTAVARRILQSSAWTLSEDAGWELTSRRVPVQPGQRYTYSLRAVTFFYWLQPPSATAHIRLLWQDAALHALSWQDDPPFHTTLSLSAGACGDPALVQGGGMAPPQAAYVQLVIREQSGEGLYTDVRLTADGVRVEPYPDAQQAALAWSFDWETAMGGLIHSRGAAVHDVAYAVRRGLAMRAGADWLAALFARYKMHATFYATGYNLLDGNTERRQFAGNPTYAWAKPKWGWSSDYWSTQPWYGDDPYGTVQSDPAWYFGDQARALATAGHEIASHTFGHLYVRGSNPQELEADAGEWDRAAQAQRLPPAASFAFPWQSSNSTIHEGQSGYYSVLAAHGIGSVTRLYPGDVVDHYALGAVPLYITPTLTISPLISVMPDFILGPAGAGDVLSDTVTAGLDEARGEVGNLAGAQQVIDTVLARRGVTSFWTHPEQLTNPDVQRLWQDTVAYADSKRQEGLWIAPVSTIASYMRDMRQVEVVWQAAPSGLNAVVTNHTDHALDGVTLSFPFRLQAVTVDGQPSTRLVDTRLVLPRLAAGATVDVRATEATP